LALYLNHAYYGNLAYGVEAAARAYFGKSVSELDLAECALLAGLPQAPALYDPLTTPKRRVGDRRLCST
jgi:membrane carboxypeptidase/penicillin-binding protein